MLIDAIVLAAGRSHRMRGTDKLTKTIDGISLLRRTVLSAIRSHARSTAVVLAIGQNERASCIRDLPVRIIFSSASSEGIAGSIRSGIAACARDAAGVIILLADMPMVSSEDINAMICEFQPLAIIAASQSGVLGNPVLFARDYFEEIWNLSGDKGARSIVDEHQSFVQVIDLPEQRALIDLDTPDDWQRWQSNQRQT